MKLEYFLLPAVLVLLASGCGGDSDRKVLREPFIEFQVNGQLAPNQLDLVWAEAPGGEDSLYCRADRFDNGQEALTSAPDYCNRSLTNVTFQVRYTNPAYEAINVSYQGIGFIARIYRYDESKEDFKGEEVWNSSYLTQTLVLAAQEFEQVDNFDPNQVVSLSLAAGNSLPSVSSYFTATFEGNMLFRGGAEYDPDTAEGNLIKEPFDTYGVECDWALVPNSATGKYRRVRCLGDKLLPDPGTGTLPVKFVASVQFNFNGWTEQPEDIIITINPPQ